MRLASRDTQLGENSVLTRAETLVVIRRGALQIEKTSPPHPHKDPPPPTKPSSLSSVEQRFRRFDERDTLELDLRVLFPNRRQGRLLRRQVAHVQSLHALPQVVLDVAVHTLHLKDTNFETSFSIS